MLTNPLNYWFYKISHSRASLNSDSTNRIEKQPLPVHLQGYGVFYGRIQTASRNKWIEKQHFYLSICKAMAWHLWHRHEGKSSKAFKWANNVKGVTISMTQQSPRPHSSHISQQLNISAVEAAPETKNPFWKDAVVYSESELTSYESYSLSLYFLFVAVNSRYFWQWFYVHKCYRGQSDLLINDWSRNSSGLWKHLYF